uniref:Uncharacterized protein n=1 Tax=Megaselia scalaris TaxID=36166 RepID=T1GM77_MEGSC
MLIREKLKLKYNFEQFLEPDKKKTSKNPHNLVDKQQVGGDDRAGVEDLFLYDVVIVNTHIDRFHRFTRGEIETNWVRVETVFFSQFNNSVLSIVTTVDSQSFWDNKERFSESLNSQTHLAFDGVLVFHKSVIGTNLKSSSTWNDTLVFDGVVYSAETISDGVLDLKKSVLVWSLHQNGH